MRHLRIHGQMDSNHVVAFGVHKLSEFNEAMGQYPAPENYAAALSHVKELQETLADTERWLAEVIEFKLKQKVQVC